MHLLADTLQPLSIRDLLGWGGFVAIGLVVGRLLLRTRWNWLKPFGTLFTFAGVFLAAGLLFNETLGRLGLVVPNSSFSVAPVWSWPITLIAGVGLWTLIALFYPPRVAHLPRRTRLLLTGLRYLTAALLVLSTLRPTLQWTRQDKQPAELLILSDVSRSMTTSDISGGVSRYASQMKLLTDSAPTFEKLRKQGVVRFFEYGQELKSVETLSNTPADSLTAIGDALADLTRQIQGKKIASMILMGDGAQRTLPPRQTDPRQSARVLGELQIPIHTITFGASQLTGTTADLMLENLQTSPTVFVKNRAVLESNLRAVGAAGRTVSVQLLVEKTSPDNPNQKTLQPEGEPLTLKPKTADEILPIQMSFVPELPGEYKVGLKVQPLDGEVLLSNNEQTTYLTVLKGGINIAYFDSLRHEQRFLRYIDESPDIQIEFIPVRHGTRTKTDPLKPDLFRPGAYDIYIIGDVPADYFGSGRARGDHLKSLQSLVENGAGLLLLGGEHSFSRGAYGNSAIADLIPVVLSSTADQAPPDLTSDLKLVPTAAGLAHYIMRLQSGAENQAVWDALPPLKGASHFGELQPLGQALANSSEGSPLLVAQTKGRGRILAFAGDTTWRWYLAGHQQEHQQFWRQVILWLAHKEDLGDENVWVKLATRRIRQGLPLDFTCGARDKQGEPLKDAQFNIEITNAAGEKFHPTAQPASRDFTGRFTDTLTPGEYLLRITGTVGGKILGLGTQARFLVYSEDLELTNPIADASLMREIAELTGGLNLRPEQFTGFLQKLSETGLSPQVEQTSAVSLWDNPFIVVLITLMLCCEWFYRKRTGLV